MLRGDLHNDDDKNDADDLTQDWGTEDGRLIYSLAVAGVQFLLPLTVLVLVHAREEHQQNVFNDTLLFMILGLFNLFNVLKSIYGQNPMSC